jgi:hypothetical protein
MPLITYHRNRTSGPASADFQRNISGVVDSGGAAVFPMAGCLKTIQAADGRRFVFNLRLSVRIGGWPFSPN